MIAEATLTQTSGEYVVLAKASPAGADMALMEENLEQISWVGCRLTTAQGH